MRQIRKVKEPNSLTLHRQQTNSNYDNFTNKNDLRISLCKEQRGICCYCMSPIFPVSSKMKIEHFYCQENNPNDQLSYWNLLGACKGNEGQIQKLQHCDSFKGTKLLKFNPITPLYKIEDQIWYKIDGTIGSSNLMVNTALNNVLNLNVLSLKKSRKATLDGFISFLYKKYNKPIKRTILEKWLSDWDGASNSDNLKPYCQVIVYWLQVKLKTNKS